MKDMLIEEKPRFATVFEWIGGEEKVRSLVEQFYDLMDREPRYSALRATHGSDLSHVREKLFLFLCGWMGGPQYYVERFGHPMLRARHLPFAIGVVERDQWVACMSEAMQRCAVDEDLRVRLGKSFSQTAEWMRNQD